MLKKILFLLTVYFLLSTGSVNADECKGGPGAIWAIHSNGDKESPFVPGEDVYLGGHNFNVPEGLYDYVILDTSDGQEKLYEGKVKIKEDGTIDLTENQPIWTIPQNPKPDYRVDLIYKQCEDKITTKKKTDTFETIPEFPTIAIPVGLALLAGLFFFRRQ